MHPTSPRLEWCQGFSQLCNKISSGSVSLSLSQYLLVKCDSYYVHFSLAFDSPIQTVSSRYSPCLATPCRAQNYICHLRDLDKALSITNTEANGIAVAIKCLGSVPEDGYVHIISRVEGKGGRIWQIARAKLYHLLMNCILRSCLYLKLFVMLSWYVIISPHEYSPDLSGAQCFELLGQMLLQIKMSWGEKLRSALGNGISHRTWGFLLTRRNL